MKTFISYEGLPINSGGAHSVYGLSSIQVYESLTRFLNACTNSPAPKVHIICESWKATSDSPGLLWDLIKRFGIPQLSLDRFFSSEQQPWEWSLKPSKIQSAFEILQWSKALTITFKWHFQFINPVTKLALEKQNEIPVLDERLKNSQIFFRASERNTVSVWFALPFSTFEETTEYFDEFSALLPFKPGVNHWRIWNLSRNGTWIPRKIEKDVR